MRELVKEAEFLIQNNNLLVILAKKIEECILNEKSICIVTSNSFVTCRNNINIEDYEISLDHLYLNENNFELHINFNSLTSISYDEIEECFTIMQNDMEFNLYFI